LYLHSYVSEDADYVITGQHNRRPDLASAGVTYGLRDHQAVPPRRGLAASPRGVAQPGRVI